MKRFLFFVLLSLNLAGLLASSAAAQGKSGTKLRPKKTAPATYNYDPDAYISDVRPYYMADGFNLGVEYMSTQSSEMDVKNKVTGLVEKDLKGDLSKESKQIGLKAGYKQIPRGGMGFDLNLSLLKLESRSEGAADITSLLPSANFVVSAPEYVYGALGLNTNFVFGDEETTYSPRIGYQVGVGAIVGKNFNFEVFYNWINTGAEAQYALMEVRTGTTNARLIYLF